MSKEFEITEKIDDEYTIKETMTIISERKQTVAELLRNKEYLERELLEIQKRADNDIIRTNEKINDINKQLDLITLEVKIKL